MVDIRSNWRVVLLVVLVVGSLGALFVPGAGPVVGSAPADNATAGGGPTNLQYGLQLSGGTRVRAPVVGLTAENVTLPSDASERSTIATTIADDLDNVSSADVRLRLADSNTSADTVEVFANVTPTQFRGALDAAGLDADSATVRQGVTAATRDEIVETLSNKVNSLGFSGAQVSVQSTVGGDAHYVVVEVPNADLSEVRDLVNSRGQVAVLAYHPVNASAQTNDTVLTNDDIRRVSDARMQEGTFGSVPVVPITLTEEGGASFAEAMQRYGYTSSAGISNCQYPNGTPGDEYCLITTRDSEVVGTYGMGETLASSIERGDFQTTNSFVLQTNSMSEARQIAIDLRAGALPASLDIESGDVYQIDASLAERFKPLSFLTGLIAALAVSLVVYLRYGRAKIAVPMLVTALSEVVILLGFSSLAGLSLNLSHIAGFIAVIGTGVDDLVIIADEVTTEAVSSDRVFQSRFRKAFWIIGGAAATTIVAMSPLAVLSLGDLRGFAIVTILGVLVGVLLTRPAYGDILRYLLTDDN
ncbi:preprotein translocase subunit SecD [Halarchaeum nitratireducens]|uniref:Protein-export membrane protein SecD n=1 Tax=Halarchaeum nitratireducens TaxID=489913 RepID=A0A830G7Z5_9EURY|nr:preprotein translocase subunit SecD [Halarchaeum nitratireducens]GGN06890.1 preprotein translocase subunit SecD [Halarchaeum nitratireducens]